MSEPQQFGSSDADAVLDPGDLDIGPTLGFLSVVWRLNHSLERASKRMETTIGVTGQQRMIIRILGRYPGITPGAVARTLWIDAGTLSAALKRLEHKGLVRRVPDTVDRRRVMLHLTDAGRAFDVPAAQSVEAAIDATLHAHTEVDIATTRAFIQAVASEVGRIAAR
jgi:DNA-binding MarR family transcriptional regulator